MAKRETFSVCPGCGFRSPSLDFPAHPFVECSPECWSYYAGLMAYEHENKDFLNSFNQLTMDAYSAQHPGGSIPDAGLDMHLVALYLTFELLLAPADLPPMRVRMATGITDWPHLERPMYLGAITASDFVEVETIEEYFELAVRWAYAVWQAWAPHHGAIAGLARRAGVMN